MIHSTKRDQYWLSVEASWCYFFENWWMKLKCPLLLKPLATIVQENSQSFYPSEPFRIIHFTMRHPVDFFNFVRFSCRLISKDFSNLRFSLEREDRKNYRRLLVTASSLPYSKTKAKSRPKRTNGLESYLLPGFQLYPIPRWCFVKSCSNLAELQDTEM